MLLVAGLNGKTMLNRQSVFPRGCTTLNSRQQWMRVPVASHPYQHLVLPVCSGLLAILMGAGGVLVFFFFFFFPGSCFHWLIGHLCILFEVSVNVSGPFLSRLLCWALGVLCILVNSFIKYSPILWLVLLFCAERHCQETVWIVMKFGLWTNGHDWVISFMDCTWCCI